MQYSQWKDTRQVGYENCLEMVNLTRASGQWGREEEVDKMEEEE